MHTNAPHLKSSPNQHGWEIVGTSPPAAFRDIIAQQAKPVCPNPPLPSHCRESPIRSAGRCRPSVSPASRKERPFQRCPVTTVFRIDGWLTKVYALRSWIQCDSNAARHEESQGASGSSCGGQSDRSRECLVGAAQLCQCAGSAKAGLKSGKRGTGGGGARQTRSRRPSMCFRGGRSAVSRHVMAERISCSSTKSTLPRGCAADFRAWRLKVAAGRGLALHQRTRRHDCAQTPFSPGGSAGHTGHSLVHGLVGTGELGSHGSHQDA